MASDPLVKKIVCLANSRKLSGRCLAGREVVRGKPGPWIRPVSDREHQEVSEDERQYSDGSDPAVLDIINVPLLKAQPAGYQRENWLLDPGFYWTKAGRLSWPDLRGFVEAPETLWVNGSSTKGGENDRVHLNSARTLRTSLYLIHIPTLTLRVNAPGADFGNGKRRVQAAFEYNCMTYRLRVTDPRIEREYLAKKDGSYALYDCYLTISLGEAWKGYSYKLVAAVITRQQAGR